MTQLELLTIAQDALLKIHRSFVGDEKKFALLDDAAKVIYGAIEDIVFAEERKNFENWLDYNSYPIEDCPLTRDEYGNYLDDDWRYMWVAWKGCLETKINSKT